MIWQLKGYFLITVITNINNGTLTVVCFVASLMTSFMASFLTCDIVRSGMNRIEENAHQ